MQRSKNIILIFSTIILILINSLSLFANATLSDSHDFSYEGGELVTYKDGKDYIRISSLPKYVYDVKEGKVSEIGSDGFTWISYKNIDKNSVPWIWNIVWDGNRASHSSGVDSGNYVYKESPDDEVVDGFIIMGPKDNYILNEYKATINSDGIVTLSSEYNEDDDYKDSSDYDENDEDNHGGGSSNFSAGGSIYVVDGTYNYNGNSFNISSDGSATSLSGGDDGGSGGNGGNNNYRNSDNTDYSNRNTGSKDPNAIVDEKFILPDAQIIIPFSDPSMEVIDGQDFQLDLFGICMAGDIGYYTGNKQYLGNNDLLSDFYQWLEKAKYKAEALSVYIERVKEILKVISGSLEGKEYFTYDTDALNSIQARKVMTASFKFKQTMELVFFGLGVIFIIYGFILVVAWLFDRSILPLMTETGLLQNGMLGLVTFNNLRADEESYDKHSASFIKVLILGFACVVIGRVIISQAFMDKLTELIVWLLNKFNGNG